MDLCHRLLFLAQIPPPPPPPKREGKKTSSNLDPYSLRRAFYEILTILPGARLELDAVRINWWSFAKRGGKKEEEEKKNVSFLPRASLTSPPAGVVRGRLVGIVAAYVWCQEHQWFAFLLYEFYKAAMLFCAEVIPKVSVAINHKWNVSADEKP